MSPQVKKQWDDSTVFILRLSMSLLAFVLSTGIGFGINWMVKLDDKVDVILQIQSGDAMWKKSAEDKFLQIDRRFQNHAAAINKALAD